MPRRQIKPEERGRKPCISSEGPLVPYQVKLPKSLKAWCIHRGATQIRKTLSRAKQQNPGYVITEEKALQLLKERNNQLLDDMSLGNKKAPELSPRDLELLE